MTLDRESSQGPIYVTVVARDKGKIPLENSCSFPISIGDINDNAPEFDAPSYQVYISDTLTSGKAVITVQASDKDLGDNGKVKYSLLENPGRYFTMNSGTIYTRQMISKRVCITIKLAFFLQIISSIKPNAQFWKDT